MPITVRFYLFAAIPALLSWWLVQLMEQDEIETPLPQLSHSTDYFSNGYVKWEMDEAGNLKSKLIADALLRYSDDGTTHLQNPKLTLINNEAPPWVIKSETGVVSQDGKQLFMNGKAILERAQASGYKALTINSSNVRVTPDRNYAETDAWAELLSPPNRTEGVGMQLVYSGNIQIKLFSKVRGKYELR